MYLEQEIINLIKVGENLYSRLGISDIHSQFLELETSLQDPDLWDNKDKLIKLNKEHNLLKNKLENSKQFRTYIDNLITALEIKDESEIDINYKNLLQKVEEIQNSTYLNGRFDSHSSILSIHAGAGGIDAQDWAAMLASMYQSFAKNQGWQLKIISLSSGEEGGVKSIMMEIGGEFSYGYLKEEAGVHRLVRISPFNSGGTRETSFALVEVIPSDLDTQFKDVEINENDLKWEYSMSSGKGGQSVNTTYSAVRLVHLPTNISVSCQNERSQLQNKQQALRYLKNKLVALEIKKNNDFKNEIKGEFITAAWGNQIRSYTLHPYKMIKDHRSNFEVSDVVGVLEEGSLLPIIWSVKKAS